MPVLRQVGIQAAFRKAYRQATAATADLPARTFRYSRKQTDDACRNALCTASVARLSGLDAISKTRFDLPSPSSGIFSEARLAEVTRPCEILDLGSKSHGVPEGPAALHALVSISYHPAVAQAYPALAAMSERATAHKAIWRKARQELAGRLGTPLTGHDRCS